MLDISVLTLFPEMFHGILAHSMVKRAIDAGQVAIRLTDFRDYSADKHRTVDDAPFGGGAGMLLKPDPLFAAMDSIHGTATPADGQDRVILLSPQGRPLTHQLAVEFSRAPRLILICGHYEGVDERVRQHLVTDEVSLGDFVLTGGEIAAMAVIDSVVRFLPGVLGNEVSAHTDSFASGLLEYPQYTRPAVYRDWEVPEVLLSGNHQRIEAWRHIHALYRTWARRPDLLADYPLTASDQSCLDRWESGDFSGLDVLELKHRREIGMDPGRDEDKVR